MNGVPVTVEARSGPTGPRADRPAPNINFYAPRSADAVDALSRAAEMPPA